MSNMSFTFMGAAACLICSLLSFVVLSGHTSNPTELFGSILAWYALSLGCAVLFSQGATED